MAVLASFAGGRSANPRSQQLRGQTRPTPPVSSGVTINESASSVSIDHSTFAGNTAGIEASRGTIRAGYTLFRRNRVGIDLVPEEQTDCAVVALTLERITYFENDKDARGQALPC
jgi:hypothetical protein